MPPADSAAASQFVVKPSHSVEATASDQAKISAPRGETSPVTSGRFSVRCMCASISRSRYMLNAAAEPALAEPPITVATIAVTTVATKAPVPTTPPMPTFHR